MLTALLRSPNAAGNTADAIGRILTAVAIPPQTKSEMLNKFEQTVRTEQGPSTNVVPQLSRPQSTRAFPDVP